MPMPGSNSRGRSSKRALPKERPALFPEPTREARAAYDAVKDFVETDRWPKPGTLPVRVRSR